jgi:ABC-2 type transport system permease protein
MHGFAVFLRKEFSEIFRTWRIWVLPVIMVFIGLASPIIAEVTPDLVSSLVSSEQTGVVIEIPDPVTRDAYLQFSKNATQMALIAVLIAVAGMISAEKRSGTAVLVLTKPVSRTGLVVAKVISNWVLLFASTVAGALLCVGVTALIFDTTLLGEFAAATALWFVLASMFIAIMALLSVVIGSQGGAAGAGIGLFLVVSILANWGPARDYSPAGLLAAGDRIVMGEQVDVVWPVLTALAVAVLAVAAAAWVFERQEL